MKNKLTIAIILSIIGIISGMVLNFNEFLMGNPASMKNLLVALAYISIWIFVLIIGIRNKNRKIIGYCSEDLYNLAFQHDLACGVFLIVVGVITLGCNLRIQSYLTPALGLLILLDAVLKLQTVKN